MPEFNPTAELESNEVALILGKDGTKMTVRIHAATEPEDGADIPEPFHVAVALAMRLLNDPEFHDEVLDWYEDHEEDGEDDEEDDGDEESDEEESGNKDEADSENGKKSN